MGNVRKRRPVALFVGAVALACAGCVELQEDWTIYPDGSGFVTFQLGLDLKRLPPLPPPPLEATKG